MLDDFLYFLSKLAGLLFSVGNLLALFWFWAAWVGVFGKDGARFRACIINLLLASFAFLLVFLPVGDWALTPLENAVKLQIPPQVDGIIMLGGDEDSVLTKERLMPVMLDSARRYMGFVKLAHQFPDAKLMYSGGHGSLTPNNGVSEADIARMQLQRLGIDTNHVAFESASRTTYENAVFSTSLIGDEAKQKSWLLVTSAYHMPRALMTFQHQGWNIKPYPVGYFTTGTDYVRYGRGVERNLYELRFASHEYFGLFWYWLRQYTGALWPD